MNDRRIGKPIPGRMVVIGCAAFILLLVLIGTLFVVKTVTERGERPTRAARDS